MKHKPFSQACENNKEPILRVLKNLIHNTTEVLEIGSGTGQHAAYFCQQLPNVIWQPTDLAINLEGIQLWREETNLENFKTPMKLNATTAEWPVESSDCIYTANTCHIMGWEEVRLFIARAGEVIRPQGYLCIYGPFNYPRSSFSKLKQTNVTDTHVSSTDDNEACDFTSACEFTSASNARFDQWLKNRNPLSGIRDITAMNRETRQAGFVPLQDNEMPANNRLVIWQKN